MEYRGVEHTVAQDERREWGASCIVGLSKKKRIGLSFHQRCRDSLAAITELPSQPEALGRYDRKRGK
jgi:hypothetical protein